MRTRSRPAQLTGWVRHVVTAGCVLVGLFAVYQVFFPLAQGNQVSLILFLAAVLPLTLLCYRSGVRLRRHAASTTVTGQPDADRLVARGGGTGGMPVPGCCPSKSQAAEVDSTIS